MIKKILSILMAVIMAFSVAQIAFAAEKFYNEEYGYWYYKENGFIYVINEERGYLIIDDYIGTGDTIYIPKTLGGYSLSVWEINAWLFSETNASAFSVDDDNEYFSVKDGVLFSKDGTFLVAYPNGKAGDSYDIPEGVEELGDGCFYYSSLKEVTLPSTLQNIGYDVFGKSFGDFYEEEDNMRYIRKIFIGGYSYFSVVSTVRDGTETIWANALDDVNCVIIPDSVTNIGEQKFFEGCLCGSEGSYAQKYAEEHDIKFIVLGEGHTHSYFVQYRGFPTCVSGDEAVFICPCGKEYTVELEANPNEHDLGMGEYEYCRNCGKPADECYTDDEECSCKCHGIIMRNYSFSFDSIFDFISDLFFRLKLIFWHLTGTHQYCECGIRHY